MLVRSGTVCTSLKNDVGGSSSLPKFIMKGQKPFGVLYTGVYVYCPIRVLIVRFILLVGFFLGAVFSGITGGDTPLLEKIRIVFTSKLGSII